MRRASSSTPVVDCGPAIIRLGDLLSRLTTLSFVAEPALDSATGWQGRGDADLSVERLADGWRISEQGRFLPAGARRAVRFQNVYRWRAQADAWGLSHERFGADRPVSLVELVAERPDRLVSRTAHRCGADRYRAVVALAADGFDLIWNIEGPAKHEHLCYRYRAARL